MESKFEILAKTFHGLEDVLADEIKELGGEDIKIGTRLVKYKGNFETLYKSNIYLRTAVRVLVPVAKANIATQDDYYNFFRKIDWEKFMNLHQTFMIDAVINSDIFKNTHFAALRAKDAIADFFFAKYKRRPDVAKEDPNIVYNIYLNGKELSLSLDSSGEPLFKRGYRVSNVEAPINEILAAGIIKKSGWDGSQPLIDPMCGSGTFSIEAAMIAKNIPPGLIRRQYAFQNWRNYKKELYNELMNNIPLTDGRFKIFTSDINEENLSAAMTNAEKALVKAKLRFKVADFFELEYKKKETPYIFLNPPYGERLKEEDIELFYKKIGDRVKNYFSSGKLYVISSNKEALKSVGLKTSSKEKLFNGALECMLHGYEIFDGNYKDYKKENKSL